MTSWELNASTETIGGGLETKVEDNVDNDSGPVDGGREDSIMFKSSLAWVISPSAMLTQCERDLDARQGVYIQELGKNFHAHFE
jgi:hypothetical protein